MAKKTGNKKGGNVKQQTKETQTIGKGDVAKLDAKSLSASTDATKAGTAPTEKGDATPAPKPAKIKVLKPDTKYRGAREAWFARLKEFEGKTEGEYIQSCKDKPPALTKNQTAENPTGWVSFFRRQGVLSLQAGA